MKLLILTSLFLSLEASAAASKLYYTDGPLKGRDVTKNTSYIGSSEICFTGKGVDAQRILWSIIRDDSEKTSSFVRYSSTTDVLAYGYVDTKCTDEGASDDECRSILTAGRCL